MTSKERFLADYRAALDWLRRLGLDVSGKRFETYDPVLERFAVEGGLDVSWSDEDKALFYDAFLSAMDLMLAHQHLTDPSRFPGLAERLAKLISGPEIEQNEIPGKDGSTEGRDIGFEVSLGAQLADAGIEPRFPKPKDGVDVECSFDGCDFLIECKRPQYERSIEPLVVKASKQLDRREASARRLPVRVIALSLGKLVREGKLLASSATLAAAREEFDAEMATHTAKLSGIWQLRQRGPESIAFHGVLLQLETPLHVRDSDSLFAAIFHGLNPSEIDDRGPEAYALGSLVRRLRDNRTERFYRDDAAAE